MLYYNSARPIRLDALIFRGLAVSGSQPKMVCTTTPILYSAPSPHLHKVHISGEAAFCIRRISLLDVLSESCADAILTQ